MREIVTVLPEIDTFPVSETTFIVSTVELSLDFLTFTLPDPVDTFPEKVRTKFVVRETPVAPSAGE